MLMNIYFKKYGNLQHVIENLPVLIFYTIIAFLAANSLWTA